MPIYNFTDQLKKGKEAEAELDAYFTDVYSIAKVTLQDDKRGIDRVFTNRKSGRVFSVEYKTDFLAPTTGNAFVEIVAVSTTNKPGWAKTCEADYLVYWSYRDAIFIIPT